MDNFSVTKESKKLENNLYTWDEKTRTFSTKEYGLILDFSAFDNVTFKTGHSCIFKTGENCTFNTGSYCIFITEDNCTFDAGAECIFDTGSDCVFKTGSDCTLITGSVCTFDTGSDCVFDTGSYCVFSTYDNCTFNTGSKCVILRKDVFEVITLKESKKIKLNARKEKGYTEAQDTKTISIDGKNIEISLESYEELIKQLIG